jgi:hypothetical protein
MLEMGIQLVGDGNRQITRRERGMKTSCVREKEVSPLFFDGLSLMVMSSSRKEVNISPVGLLFSPRRRECRQSFQKSRRGK